MEGDLCHIFGAENVFLQLLRESAGIFFPLIYGKFLILEGPEGVQSKVRNRPA